MTAGTYLYQLIEQRSGEVAKAQNDAGYVAMWPEAVREVLATFPSLSREERASLRGIVEGQVKLMCRRTQRDPDTFTPALQEVERILDDESQSKTTIGIKSERPTVQQRRGLR